jgi:hypothetical protein
MPDAASSSFAESMIESPTPRRPFGIRAAAEATGRVTLSTSAPSTIRETLGMQGTTA